jgi:hypothetical protein
LVVWPGRKRKKDRADLTRFFGVTLEDLQDPTGAYAETAGVTETADRLFIHSLHAPMIGWLPR